MKAQARAHGEALLAAAIAFGRENDLDANGTARSFLAFGVLTLVGNGMPPDDLADLVSTLLGASAAITAERRGEVLSDEERTALAELRRLVAAAEEPLS